MAYVCATQLSEYWHLELAADSGNEAYEKTEGNNNMRPNS